MSKSKKEMVEDMRITITAMSEIFEWADIDGALCVPKESENLRVDFLRKGYKWLYNIVYPAFQDAINIWKLQPSERLLRLRKIVRAKSRPDFFKRGKINAAIKNLHKKGTRKSSKKTTQ
jgi:hypothetical protein